KSAPAAIRWLPPILRMIPNCEFKCPGGTSCAVGTPQPIYSSDRTVIGYTCVTGDSRRCTPRPAGCLGGARGCNLPEPDGGWCTVNEVITPTDTQTSEPTFERYGPLTQGECAQTGAIAKIGCLGISGDDNVTFQRNLSVGSRGADVSKLQRLLVNQGLLESSGVTGYFGPLTKDALARFQRQAGITPAGSLGPLTRDYLQSYTKNGFVDGTIHQKIHPLLERDIAQQAPDNIVEVLVTLREDQIISPHSDFMELAQKRKSSQAELIQSMEPYGMKVVEQFWLVNGFAARVPIGKVRLIAKHLQVVYIQPRFGGEPPPGMNPN
ncbi:MAG: peptidoglycan-binding domain-containing protein, partial [Patescibacteria group bacterium]